MSRRKGGFCSVCGAETLQHRTLCYDRSDLVVSARRSASDVVNYSQKMVAAVSEGDFGSAVGWSLMAREYLNRAARVLKSLDEKNRRDEARQ